MRYYEKPFNNIIFGINGCMSVNTLWTLITYNLKEDHSQQVNQEANGQLR